MPIILLDYDAVIQLNEEPHTDTIVSTVTPKLFDFLTSIGVKPNQDLIVIYYDQTQHADRAVRELLTTVRKMKQPISAMLNSAMILAMTVKSQNSDLCNVISRRYRSDRVLVISPHAYIQRECAAARIKMVKLYDTGEPSILDSERLTASQHQHKSIPSNTKILLDIDDTTLIRPQSLLSNKTVTNPYLPPLLKHMLRQKRVAADQLYFLSARHHTGWDTMASLQQIKQKIIQLQQWKETVEDYWITLNKIYQAQFVALSKKIPSATVTQLARIKVKLESVKKLSESSETELLSYIKTTNDQIKLCQGAIAKQKPDVKALEVTHEDPLSHQKVAAQFKTLNITINTFEGSFAKVAYPIRDKGVDIYNYYAKWKSENSSQALTIVLFDDDLTQLQSARMMAEKIAKENQQDRLCVVRIHRRGEYCERAIAQGNAHIVAIRKQASTDTMSPDYGRDDESSDDDLLTRKAKYRKLENYTTTFNPRPLRSASMAEDDTASEDEDYKFSMKL